MTDLARSPAPTKCSDEEFAELTRDSTAEGRAWLRQFIDMYEALTPAEQAELRDSPPVPDGAHDPELPLFAADCR